MKLVYKGKFTSEADLPVRVHPKGAVPFREAESMKKMAVIVNLLSIPVIILTLAGLFWRMGDFDYHRFVTCYIGIIASLFTLFPHELLHALCFRGEVEMWTNLKMGMMFVVGTEDMSKGRFVFLSMLPNLVFGWIPYLLFMLHPQWVLLGGLGAMCIPMGAGDYYNVYNCLTQVPKGALVYMSGMRTYWYLP